MSPVNQLELLWPLDAQAPLPAGVHETQILGEIRFGTSDGLPGAAPCVRVRVPTLNPVRPWRALWCTGRPVSAGQHGPVRYRHTEELLFGALAVDESDFRAVGEASALQLAAEHAYAALFAALGETGFSGLLRVWNYLPRINHVENGIERYRQFNIGRQDAFTRCGRALTGAVPAASALGVGHGALEIGFIASRSPLHAIENPRQVSAYDYPSEYGPRSPTFSRASLARCTGQDLLFVSGTASIVGHRTVHVGDVAAQTRETLSNIEAVLGAAARLDPRMPPTPAGLGCLAYLRRAADLGAVRAQVEDGLGADAQVCYVQADVCRADLLVEIEASGGHAIRGVST